KIQVHYPTNVKGQVYIPMINWALMIGCLFVVLYFQRSSAMEAAYGLAITIAMLMTSVLLVHYLKDRYGTGIAILSGVMFFSLEGLFFLANLLKFHEGGWVSLLICLIFAGIMLVWFRGNQLEHFFTSYLEIEPIRPILEQLSRDTTVPKYATNLVYITRAHNPKRIEHHIVYSILRKQPKRADVYWLLHTRFSEDPHRLSYEITEILPGRVIRIDVNLGFKIPARMNLYFQEIIAELRNQQEVDVLSRYPSLRGHGVLSDFRYVVIETAQNFDYIFPFRKQFLLNLFFWLKRHLVNRVKSYGLDPSLTTIESVPMMTSSLIFESSVNSKIEPEEIPLEREHRETPPNDKA
ncbi:MAG: KUP/HAK/KT family potassium transporter, partial [Alistipes sp.]|nr:KUP/HAK/KT family potassium transporter [Alistipes sp.]